MRELKQQLRDQAHELGFDVFGVCDVRVELRKQYYRDWIRSGKHGGMGWMERNNDRRLFPETILGEARSILALGMNYYQPDPGRRGRIAKYALGKDYHKILLKKLKILCRMLRAHGGEQKPYVDTGPVMEKPIAVMAGLGWQGKNTLLLNQQYGTWLFLGVIITTLELEPDAPGKDRCGSCDRCQIACPTQAITAPYQLDARKCIAYLTIEHEGPIPAKYREAIGDRLFGCDDCLDVCPWNRWAQTTRETKFHARPYPDLREMLAWDEVAFAEHFQGTPLKRLRLDRWLRNICMVLGNIGNADDLLALDALVAQTARRLATSGEETSNHERDRVVLESAQWAIERIKRR